MAAQKDIDVVILGATGFVGRRIVAHFASQHGGHIRWALAGRSIADLRSVKEAFRLPDAIPCLRADTSDVASLRLMAERSKVVISTVGPYQKLGTPLVAACVAAGAGYVDLNGEPLWAREMIDTHEAAAKASGARIVFSCGYDSIPFEFGVSR